MKKIAILARSPNLEWHPKDDKNGVPGSEEAAIYTAMELAKSNFEVVVFGNPGKNSEEMMIKKVSPENSSSIWENLFCEGLLCNQKENQEHVQKVHTPRFLFFEQLSSWTEPFDMVLCWRRLDPEMKLGIFSKAKFFYWPHDGAHIMSIDAKRAQMFTGIFFLSQYQRREYLQKFPFLKQVPNVIGGNGIVPEHFHPQTTLNFPLEKIPYRCAYISSYANGLETLLEIWPQVKKLVPLASLFIYYGRETWGCLSAERMNRIVNRLKEYKEKYDVVEVGKVGHIQLADALWQTSIWTYTCNAQCNETFCISALKAQAAGCIPVTTRNGALQETVHPEAPTVPILSDSEAVEMYKKLLIQTLQDSEPDSLIERKKIWMEREKYRKFALHHTWKGCVESWIKLFKIPQVRFASHLEGLC